MKRWQRYYTRHKLGNIKNLYYFVLAKARNLEAPFRKKSGEEEILQSSL
ncbi:MAG: hypothetical protein H5T45_00235 [Thermoplasmatales archaeon]|nr:hypothetical protein [Thermoplasmatales archaeon]